MKALPLFRRFQFSLLSLLVLMTASSVGSVVIGREMRHRQAVNTLERLAPASVDPSSFPAQDRW